MQRSQLLALAALLTLYAPAVARAQQREIQRYSANSDEGRLMAFYSSILSFAPLAGSRASGLELELEVTYIPRLDANQRSAGYDKPEATNLAPVLPRPRLRTQAGPLVVEVSWLPPVRVFGARANLASAAVAMPLLRRRAKLEARLAASAGRTEGPITCNAEVAEQSPDLRTYYRTVCRNRDSRDFFEPRHLSGDLVLSRGGGTLQTFLVAGARGDLGTRFDIGVARPDGSYRDEDHPVLTLHAVRPQFAAGMRWQRSPAFLAGQIFYAPGSVLTVRASAGGVLR